MKKTLKKTLTFLLTVLLALTLGACGGGDEKTEWPAQSISKAEALNVAMKLVERGDFWTKADYDFTMKDIHYLDDTLLAFEISVFKKDKTPMGYVNVPIDSNPAIPSYSFTYQGASLSAGFEETYQEKWSKALKAAGIQVVSKKIVGGLDGAFGMAVKTDRMDKVIKDAKRVDGYYVFTTRPVMGFLPES